MQLKTTPLYFAGKQEVIDNLRVLREHLPNAGITAQQLWLSKKDIERADLESQRDTYEKQGKASDSPEVKAVNRKLKTLNLLWDVSGAGIVAGLFTRELVNSKATRLQRRDAALKVQEAVRNIAGDSEQQDGIAAFEQSHGQLTPAERILIEHETKLSAQCRLNPIMRMMNRMVGRMLKDSREKKS